MKHREGSTPGDLPLCTEVPAGLPASLLALTAPCYVHRAAQWKVTALLGLALAVVVASLAFGLRHLDPARIGAAEVAFALFLLVFLAVLLRPSTWRAPVTAAADRQGIFFVGGRDSVFVPWSEIGPLAIERVNQGEGVGECVVVAIANESRYWDAAKRSLLRDWMMGDEIPAGYHRVPIFTQGIAPKTTLACLEALRDARSDLGR